MSMTVSEVFEKARAYGFIQPNLVTNFPQLAQMVQRVEDEREAEAEAEADARADIAWALADPRTERQRAEDDHAAREEAWMLGR